MEMLGDLFLSAFLVTLMMLLSFSNYTGILEKCNPLLQQAPFLNQMVVAFFFPVELNSFMSGRYILASEMCSRLYRANKYSGKQEEASGWCHREGSIALQSSWLLLPAGRIPK